MEHTASDTLGNARHVARIPVDKYEGGTGSADAPMRPRGTVVLFEKSNTEILATTVMNKKTNTGTSVGGTYQAATTFQNRAAGILAESCADTNRRKPRPGRQAVPFVMPITFQGADVVKVNNSDQKRHYQLDTEVYPGDFLYVTSDGNVTTTPGTTNMFVGVASVGTSTRSDSVQLRVDTNAPFC